MQKRMNDLGKTFDWDAARLFLKVAQAGSLTAAAVQAEVSQSTLSRQMAGLEKQLSMTLFERVGRGIQITAAGEQLLQFLQVMQEAAEQVSLTAAGLAESLAGKVTITVSEIDAAFRIPKIVQSLRERAPEIQLDVLVTNELADLKTREADIAIRSARPEQPDLIARQLATERIDIFGHADYLNAIQKKNFAGVQILGFSQVERIIGVLNQKGWSLTPENFQLQTNFQWLQLELAKQGQGLAILPTDIGESLDLEKIRRTGEMLFELPVWLVSHRELRTNPRVRFVFDLLIEQLSYH